MWENAYLSIKNPKALGPWTPATDCSLCSHDSALLHQQLLASEAGTPLDQILDPHLIVLDIFSNKSYQLDFSLHFVIVIGFVLGKAHWCREISSF